MKRFNLRSIETHPDGSVILYGDGDRHIRITRGPKGTHVETAISHTATYFWRDEAFDDSSVVHGVDISGIPFAPRDEQPGDKATLI